MYQTSPSTKFKNFLMTIGIMALFVVYWLPQTLRDYRYMIWGPQTAVSRTVVPQPTSMPSAAPNLPTATTGGFHRVEGTEVVLYKGPRRVAAMEGHLIRTCVDTVCEIGSDWMTRVVVDDGDLVLVGPAAGN